MKSLHYAVAPAGWLTCLWLKRLWPGCLLTRLNGMVLREGPPPPLPGPEWVLCRTLLGGICGTDLTLIQQRQPPNSILQSFSSLPMVLGHENVAVVDQAGPAVDKSWLGKRVCVEPTLSCRPRGIDPPCLPCQLGQYGACENFSADGEGAAKLPPGTSVGYCRATGGAWGERFVAHQSQLIEPPEAMTDRSAVLTDPLACSLHAVFRAGLGEGAAPACQRVLVYGGGILGLGVVWALRAVGFSGQIDIIARHEHQRVWARKLGASECLRLPKAPAGRFEAVAARAGGRVTRARFGNYMLSGGYDAVFECAGSAATIEESLKWARARGRVVFVGTGHGRGADLTPVWFRELDISGAYGRSDEQFRGRRVHTYRLVHELMRAGPDVSGLLTHTFTLGEYKKALAAALDKGGSGAIKVAFEFPSR